MRTATVVVGALLSLAATSGCSSGPPLHLRVAGGPVLVDDGAPVVVTGAAPGRRVEITATSEDSGGHRWRSRATYLADGSGKVDTATSAPVSGDYRRASATGLVFSLHSRPSQLSYVAPAGTMTVRYHATQDGRDDDRAVQRRTYEPPGVSLTETDRGSDGIVATYVTPSRSSRSGTAVLVLGGSEGGAPVGSALGLAMRGHPSLALAYFGKAGVPRQLRDVPVEYVGRALHWLAGRDGVDRIVVEGSSRGTEAALLAAVHYPGLVAGVVLGSPTSFVNTSLPTTDGAAFTWRGRPVPHATADELDEVEPREASANIAVSRIRVPVLMVCGEDDHLWPSCGSSDRIVRRSPGLPRTVLKQPSAGHLVDFLVPGIPISSGIADGGTYVLDVGGTREADAVARLRVWPRVLAFLRRLS